MHSDPTFVSFADSAVATAGLVVAGGSFRGSSGMVQLSEARVPLTDNATNYVFIDTTTSKSCDLVDPTGR
jgi:hypothetical protein